ncbi:ABC transporter ATP-binding protein [Clostridium magnum]|uniref:Putative multidrug resistance ABC transporter ATP-binding/permease protein YheI n=1 Tax=Clostridium magnum DSM 2767 TaxID=1121326 RepID=A0A162QWK1_9CLOT|nr:ABC transporter ATP-binding protein [Clostridium magnum]KZL89071.1 putative multidrug resistance ABC transporter ATP-binding/permease protein YheI [Clostridium magnum DSM 2767]SHI29876.1 ATP-binding cassette, subfamily B [Clostridium magnum DSM 2767]
MGKKILINFIKEHLVSYSIGIVFMLLTSYIQTLFPKVLGNTIDILKVNNFNPKSVYLNLVYIVLIAVGTFASTYAWRNLIIGNGRTLECYLREKLFDHFQKLSPEFYNKRKTGDLIAYAINDINAVRMTFGPATSMAIKGIVICVISVYSMAKTINWGLTILVLVPIPIIIFVMFHIGKIVRKRFKKVQESFAAISDRVQENISGIRVIKAYVQEEDEVKKFEELNEQMVESNLKMVGISAYVAPLIELCFSISFVLNLIIGGNMALEDKISLGQFIAFNGYLTMIMAPIISIGRIITIVQRGMASLGRLNEIFNVNPEIKEGDNLIKAPIKGTIEIKNLSFSYPNSKEIALRDINLIIPQGHTLGIIGKTGSGKSTLINLLLKMYNVSNEKILFDGIDINDYELNTLRDSFGFVPQENFLFNASVSDNIKFFKDTYSKDEMINAAQNSCIYESIMGLPKGFDEILGERGVNISGGQKQRISIARALIKNPQILILDDSLSAVDTITEKQILKNLKTIRKNKTTIIIAHRISAVIDADEIIVLDKGKILERGTHLELVKKGGLYYDIHNAQSQNS